MLRLAKFLDAGLYLVIAFFVIRDWRGDRRQLIAMSISVLCFVLWMVAREQLGSAFAVRAEARKLVTTGLYSRIRHPIYFFAMIAFSAELIAGGWYLALGLCIVFNIPQLLRIRREERVLAAAFGDEYLAYKAGTWF